MCSCFFSVFNIVLVSVPKSRIDFLRSDVLPYDGRTSRKIVLPSNNYLGQYCLLDHLSRESWVGCESRLPPMGLRFDSQTLSVFLVFSLLPEVFLGVLRSFSPFLKKQTNNISKFPFDLESYQSLNCQVLLIK